jgi:MFS family permease
VTSATPARAGVTPPPLPRHAWLIVGLLWFVALFNYLSRVMMPTMHGSIVAAIPMSDAQFGLLTSAFLWIYGLLNPIAGYLSDRLGRSRVILISMLVWSAVTCLTAYAKTFEQLLIMRILMGVSETCYFPAALALISEYHRGPTRSLACGLHMTGVLCGAALGGLGGWLAEVRSWHFAFSLLGYLGIAYGIGLVFILRDAPRAPEDTGLGDRPIGFGPALTSMGRSPAFLRVFAFACFAGAIGYSMLGWMPTYLHEHYHLRQGAAGFSATGYLNFAEFSGVFIGGLWSDRWSRTQPRARALVLAIGYCLAAPGIFLVAHAGVLFFALAGLMLWGLASGFMDSNLMPVICLVVDRRSRAMAYGLINMGATVAGGLAIYGVGLLRDRGLDYGHMLGVAAFCVIFCPLFIFGIKPRSDA